MDGMHQKASLRDGQTIQKQYAPPTSWRPPEVGDIKKRIYFPSFIITKAKIKVLFSFNQFVKLLFCILHFLNSWAALQKKWLPHFLAVEIKKRMMCEKTKSPKRATIAHLRNS